MYKKIILRHQALIDHKLFGLLGYLRSGSEMVDKLSTDGDLPLCPSELLLHPRYVLPSFVVCGPTTAVGDSVHYTSICTLLLDVNRMDRVAANLCFLQLFLQLYTMAFIWIRPNAQSMRGTS